MYKLFFDGGKKDNYISYGIVIYHENKVIYKGNGQIHNKKFSCNAAEYISLIIGLISAKALGIKKIEIYGDSLIVINQLTKKYATKSEIMKELGDICLDILTYFDEYSLTWIPRKMNSEAHRETKI